MSINNKVSDEEKLSQLMDGEWHQLAPAESVASLCADEAQRARWMRYHLIRDALRNEPVQVDNGLAARISAAIDDEEDYSNVTQFNAGHEQSVQPEEFDEGQRAAVGSIDQSSAVFDKVGVASGSDITQMTTRHDTSRVNTGIAGFAIAASVALVTVVGINTFKQSAPSNISSVAATSEADNVRTLAVAERGVAVPAVDANAAFIQDANVTLPVVEFVANTGPGYYWSSPDSSTRAQDEKRLNMLLSEHIENSPTSSREGLLPYSRLVGYKSVDQER